MREHGLSAPGDLAVIGVDDIPTARLAAPPLTTVGLDLQQASRVRAERIVASLTGTDSDLLTAREDWKVINRSSA
jgi:DNA-binding LacI/PurR family transcriptional regulator